MIPYGRHDIDEEDIQAVIDVLGGDWLTTGPAVEAFELALAQATGGTPAVAVSSGTAALHTAYAAADLGPGDEVITPPITFVATQAALIHLGATPVFADVQPDTGLICPLAVEAAISTHTAAVVAVDFAGHPADMDALRRICDKYKLLLIEDAAHSIGSTYKGRPVGALADITTFSFFPTKNITTGEGGAVVSPHPEILKRARRFSRQGLIREAQDFVLQSEGSWHQEVHKVGLNYRLSDIQAALGTVQLRKLPIFRERRQHIKQVYDSALGQVPQLGIPTCHSWADPVWHLYPLQVPEARRAHFFHILREAGVGVQVNYLPAYRHPALQSYARAEDFPASEQFYSREVSLPIHTKLQDVEVARVVDAVTHATQSLGIKQ